MYPKCRFVSSSLLLVVTALVWTGCSSDAPAPTAQTGGSTGQGSGSSGGASTASQGGVAVASGGVGSGGVLETGGALAAGGALATGGTASGGALATGGTASGGAPATGGTASGGAPATGGTASGGALATGGTVSGGVPVTGGASATGGATSTGGKGSGGAPGTGGKGSGGSTTGPGPDAGVAPGRDGTAVDYPPSTGKPTVYIAGDSTVSTYATNAKDQQGWGQRIQEFFTSDVTIVNKAIGGESSKSFIDEGHLTEILAVIKPGDYLFAQWGINDRSVAGPTRATDPATTFRTYLKQYIDGARGKNAIPVLITPTPRHQYTGGVFENGFPEYCAAIIAVGAETNTPVIDLQSKGLAYYTSIGDAKVTSTIILDALHFVSAGAYQMARLVAQGVVEINVPISQYVIQSKLAAH